MDAWRRYIRVLISIWMATVSLGAVASQSVSIETLSPDFRFEFLHDRSSPDSVLMSALRSELSSLGFFSVQGDQTSRLPLLWGDEVFFHRSLLRVAWIKFGLRSARPGDDQKLFSSSGVFIYVSNHSNAPYTLILSGTSPSETQEIVETLRNKSAAAGAPQASLISPMRRWMNRISLIQSAQAADEASGCSVVNDSGNLVSANGSQLIASANEVVQDAESGITKRMLSCLKEAMRGAKDGVTGIWNMFRHPIQTTRELIEGFKKVATELGALWKDFRGEASRILSNFESMTTQQISNLVCSFLGEVGVQALIAAITGAGVASLIPRIKAYLERFSAARKIAGGLEKSTKTETGAIAKVAQEADKPKGMKPSVDTVPPPPPEVKAIPEKLLTESDEGALNRLNEESKKIRGKAPHVHALDTILYLKKVKKLPEELYGMLKAELKKHADLMVRDFGPDWEAHYGLTAP